MYTIQELGPLPGTVGVAVHGMVINNRGDAAGTGSRTESVAGPWLGLAWVGGHTYDLVPDHPESLYVRVFCINDGGYILGQPVLPGLPAQPIFRWHQGVREYNFADTPPNAFPGVIFGVACINNLGVMAGNANIVIPGMTRTISHVIRWDADGHHPTDLGSLGGDAVPTGLNDQGDIVGGSYLDVIGDAGARPFVIRNGVMRNLSDGYTDYLQGEALAISSSGIVCGFVRDSGHEPRPVLWDAQNARRLLPGNTRGYAWGVNSDGTAVGEGFDVPDPTGPAVVWQDGVMYNLGARVVNLAQGGWDFLASAQGINNRGQIVGYGSRLVSPAFWDLRGFILTPVQPVCYANCDGSSSSPVLDVRDFVCFQARFAAGDSYANCDGSTAPPVLNVGDFICFQQRFAAGCP